MKNLRVLSLKTKKTLDLKRQIAFNVRLCGPVAQSVEQWTENPRVGGSIPPRTTISFLLPISKSRINSWSSYECHYWTIW